MAGNKVNTKTKGKDDKTKANKNQNNEEGEELDFAMLRRPIPTSITGLAQARKIFDLATEELKDLLSKECDLLYECKVCRNIFRSLANFISHKRVFCKEKFNTSVHSHFVNMNSTANEIEKIRQTEEGYQDSLKQTKAEGSEDSNHLDERIPLTKDLTAVYEKIMKTKGVYNNIENSDVVLQKIPSSSVAVFQSMKGGEHADKMRNEISELNNILSHDKAVLHKDGKFTIESSKEDKGQDQDNVIQISDDDDDDDDPDVLKCKICDLQFSTQKTLKFHMKYKHLESRLVYPCPDCLEIFSTSWSVYRHLFKVHRKTAAQIRRLRESIQAKAFRMNNPPAFYEKRKSNLKPAIQKITEEERIDQENQAWMDNMEGAGEGARCGGCGRAFERRAALAAHTHTCPPRVRALRRPDKKIEIQIRKDYPKPVSGLTIIKNVDVLADNKGTSEDTQQPVKLQVDEEKPPEIDDKDVEESPMDMGDDDQKSNDSSESPEKNEDMKGISTYQPMIRLPFAVQAEKSNLAAFKQRIQPDVAFYKLLCKKCHRTFRTISDLFEHMADHFKWMRYACKLCNYKHYNFENLPEHVKTVHKLKGDKDFYFSTVKAIDGTEAMIISRCLTESDTLEDAETHEVSPDSRRPSRCSSDSSRLSDDSSSSNTVKESSIRKRKLYNAKNNAKRKKESTGHDDGDDQKDGEVSLNKVSILDNSSSQMKSFEENSSDIDDVEDKLSKKHKNPEKLSAISRRPVRKRTKPKHEDFEYDLSNLLKMEAQGYRDSQQVTSKEKTSQPKKKVPIDNVSDNLDNVNRDCCGAMVTLSKKAIEKAAAHMKTSNSAIFTVKEPRSSNVFARPMLPRILSRGDKGSPKKDATDDLKEVVTNKVNKYVERSKNLNNSKEKLQEDKIAEKAAIPKVSDVQTQNEKPINKDDSNLEDTSCYENENTNENDSEEMDKPKSNLTIPAVFPIKFRRQSLEIIKSNPIINKNITDFTKAGMKTKILVIKPINRKDGSHHVNTPLKFQTIKLKDPTKNSNDDMHPDQVMVVKVPKVPCTAVSDKTSFLNANTVDGTNNHENSDKCDEGETMKVTVNKGTENNSDENITKDVTSEIVTENSDEVSDIVVKNNITETDKLEKVEPLA